APVDGAQRERGAHAEREALGHGERYALEALGEGLALEPLHDQVGLAARRGAALDVADDARVLEPREHLGLARKALYLQRAHVVQHLDGHRLARAPITRAIDLPHAPRSRGVLDLEAVGEDVSFEHRIPGPRASLIILSSRPPGGPSPPRARRCRRDR